MDQRLVLEDDSGKVVRAYQWSGEPVQLIRRADTGRLELRRSLSGLKKLKVQHQQLGELTLERLQGGQKLLLGELGHLSLVESIDTTVVDPGETRDGSRSYYTILIVLLLVFAGVGYWVSQVPLLTEKREEQLKQEVVKIARIVQPPRPAAPIGSVNVDSPVKPAQRAVALKRLGALSVLGSLKNSPQKGGLNLGQRQVTAGPGLGGNAGSGGVQTSIYSKGLVGAPLGAGGNIRGAGGVGTKGKGGGQAGYGSLSLVGSSGAAPIPLGAEASVAKGLDKDQIAAVINRNLGQVRFCYEQGLQGDAGLNGRVAVGFSIGGNGLVQAAQVESSTLNSKVVEDCLVLRLKSWKFPLPEGGVVVKVSYPFVLRRSGQG